jgi:hypothetical protein
MELVNPVYFVSSYKHAFQQERVVIPLKHDLKKNIIKVAFLVSVFEGSTFHIKCVKIDQKILCVELILASNFLVTKILT